MCKGSSTLLCRATVGMSPSRPAPRSTTTLASLQTLRSRSFTCISSTRIRKLCRGRVISGPYTESRGSLIGTTSASKANSTARIISKMTRTSWSIQSIRCFSRRGRATMARHLSFSIRNSEFLIRWNIPMMSLHLKRAMIIKTNKNKERSTKWK